MLIAWLKSQLSELEVAHRNAVERAVQSTSRHERFRHLDNADRISERMVSLVDEIARLESYITKHVEECEHGMSADLCVGPSHYPMDM